MKKHLFILAVIAGLVGCATESRTVVREVGEPAGSSTTIIDTDDDDDDDKDLKIEAETDRDDGKLKVDAEVED